MCIRDRLRINELRINELRINELRINQLRINELKNCRQVGLNQIKRIAAFKIINRTGVMEIFSRKDEGTLYTLYVIHLKADL